MAVICGGKADKMAYTYASYLTSIGFETIVLVGDREGLLD